MTREIKFRAWGSTSKSMIPWQDLRQNLSLAFEQAKRDAIILMQFTGLKDKNGKEIYHGDCLSADGHFFVVKWDDRAAAFRFVDDAGNSESPLNYDHIEVIGNIYENPELLK
jgi:uncharacterized phage protein (TIGR01671 family)